MADSTNIKNSNCIRSDSSGDTNNIFVARSASGGEVVETSSQTTNPMVKLFCGQFLSAGINEGKMLFSWLLIEY